MPPESTTSDLTALLRASEAIRQRFEPQAFLNLAFYVGEQWTAWDGTQLWEPPLEAWRERVTDNRIQPVIRTEIAKLTKTKPTWISTPKTMSDEDVSASRYAEMFVDDAWRQHNMRRLLRGALTWARVTGAGYWKVWWDPTLGGKTNVLVNTETGKVARAANGAPVSGDMLDSLPEEMREMVTPRDVAMGEICVELRNFFQIFPDPHANEEGLNSAEWVGEKAVYTQDYIRRHFPDKADELSYTANPSVGAGKGRVAYSKFAESASAHFDERTQGVELCEYWSKDKHCIWSAKDEIVLIEEDNPYPWLPYVMFRGTPVPGQFYPDCPVTQLVPRQVSLNKVLSQIEENAERIGNPPFLRPAQMADEDWQWRGLPGEEVVYNDTGTPGAIPSFMQVPEMPGYVQNLVSTIERSIQEISGQHEVTGAQVPAGVTAASAIQLLQEQDDTRLGPDIDEMSVALEEAGERVLWLAGRYYTDERHIRVTGEDGAWDVLAFKGNFLKGHTDIEVQIGSGLPQSKAAKQAAISQMLTLFVQNGVAMSERQLRRIVSQFEVGGLEQFFANQERDTRQVQEENRKLSLIPVQPLDINSFDNDETHIEEHEDFQKTARYQMLPPENKQAFEEHVAAHRDRLGDLQQQQMQMMPPEAGPQAPPPTNGTAPPGSVPSMPTP